MIPETQHTANGSLTSCFPDAFRSLVIADGVRLGLKDQALTAYVEREARLAQLEALSEYRGDWTDEEAAEYFALSDMQMPGVPT